MLTTEGIQPQITKVLPILKFSPPKNRRQLRGFLGLINYYKKLIHRCSHILTPLTKLLSDKTKFIWTNEQANAFEDIKKVMARKVLLIYPDFKKSFHLYTDASDYQLGSVIM